MIWNFIWHQIQKKVIKKIKKNFKNPDFWGQFCQFGGKNEFPNQALSVFRFYDYYLPSSSLKKTDETDKLKPQMQTDRQQYFRKILCLRQIQ